jgi:hypothetical protein
MDTPRTRDARLRVAGFAALCLAASTSPIRSLPLYASANVTQSAAVATLDQIVERAQRYVVEYGAQMSIVIGVERYKQSVQNVDASMLGGPVSERPGARETVAEFALVRVKDDWLGYRDVYEVDGKTVSDRRDRLQELFERSPSTALEQGRRIADESARYNAGALPRNVNVPTMALFFLHPSNARRFRFERAGTDSIGGTPVWKVRYREVQQPTIVRTSGGRNMPVKGTFWINPSDGRVLRTFMELTTEADLSGSSGKIEDPALATSGAPAGATDHRVEAYSRVTTSYRLDDRLGLLVPADMTEDYQGVSVNRATGRDRVIRINCRATYSDFKRFETSGRVVVKEPSAEPAFTRH